MIHKYRQVDIWIYILFQHVLNLAPNKILWAIYIYTYIYIYLYTSHISATCITWASLVPQATSSAAPRCQVHGAEGQADQGAEDGRNVLPFLAPGDAPQGKHHGILNQQTYGKNMGFTINYIYIYSIYLWRIMKMIAGWNLIWRNIMEHLTRFYYQMSWFPVGFPHDSSGFNDLLLV